MLPEDFENFSRVLDAAYSLHSKSLSADARALFFAALGKFSLADVRKAFSAHISDPQRGQYPPKPADLISALTPNPLNDGRPDENEAWVTALAGNDEFRSVRWTAETAQALTDDVKDQLKTDEVAARMAFKAIYARLCREARAAGRPVEWFVSWSFDRLERENFARQALQTGTLQIGQAKQHVPALAAPAEEYDIEKARRQLASIKALLATALSGREKIAQQRAREIQAEKDRLAQLKLDTAIRVAEYEGSNT